MENQWGRGLVWNMILSVVKDPRGHHPTRWPDLSDIVEWLLREQIPEPNCLGSEPSHVTDWSWDLS